MGHKYVFRAKVDANMTFIITLVIVSTRFIFVALIVHVFSVTVCETKPWW